MLQDIPTLESLVVKCKENFVKHFGIEPTIAACAPGRVNLIGEHTDYNDGFVLPMALPLVTVVVGRPNGKNYCTITTLADVDQKAGEKTTFDLPSEKGTNSTLKPGLPHWANYVKGVVANFNNDLVGFDATICSTVPLGGGLSSSAALEVATFTFLEALTNFKSKPQDKALICQRAEHEFAGMPCGIMDQFISTMATEKHALLIDCKTLDTTLIPIDDKDVVFLITNSNVKHKLTGSEYPQRRAQCQNAATLLGEPSLRNVKMKDLEVLTNLKVDQVTINRAKHVITEIDRTIDAAQALKDHDLIKMGNLMNESHNSLRDLFEVSCPELDSLVDIARSVDGVYGSRMTGGGFGGCTVTLLKKSSVEKLMKTITSKYTGKPTFYVCSPADKARIISLS